MKNIMVCVTQQKTCERLIRHGHELLNGEDGELFVIHVAQYEFKFLGHEQEGEALEFLYGKAMEYGANLTVVRSNHVTDTLINLIDKNKITHVIIGQSGPIKTDFNAGNEFTARVKDKAELIVVPAN